MEITIIIVGWNICTMLDSFIWKSKHELKSEHEIRSRSFRKVKYLTLNWVRKNAEKHRKKNCNNTFDFSICEFNLRVLS